MHQVVSMILLEVSTCAFAMLCMGLAMGHFHYLLGK